MKTRSLLVATLLLGIAAIPAAFGADASPSPAAKVTKFPFHGKISAVDTSAMTFTLSGKTPRVFSVTDTTKIRKNGQTATLKDAAVGDDSGGYAQKDASGKLTALSVRFGPRTATKASASPASASSSPAASPTPKAKHMKKSKASPSPSPTAS